MFPLGNISEITSPHVQAPGQVIGHLGVLADIDLRYHGVWSDEFLVL